MAIKNTLDALGNSSESSTTPAPEVDTVVAALYTPEESHQEGSDVVATGDQGGTLPTKGEGSQDTVSDVNGSVEPESEIQEIGPETQEIANKAKEDVAKELRRYIENAEHPEGLDRIVNDLPEGKFARLMYVDAKINHEALLQVIMELIKGRASELANSQNSSVRTEWGNYSRITDSQMKRGALETKAYSNLLEALLFDHEGKPVPGTENSGWQQIIALSKQRAEKFEHIYNTYRAYAREAQSAVSNDGGTVLKWEGMLGKIGDAATYIGSTRDIGPNAPATSNTNRWQTYGGFLGGPKDAPRYANIEAEQHSLFNPSLFRSTEFRSFSLEYLQKEFQKADGEIPQEVELNRQRQKDRFYIFGQAMKERTEHLPTALTNAVKTHFETVKGKMEKSHPDGTANKLTLREALEQVHAELKNQDEASAQLAKKALDWLFKMEKYSRIGSDLPGDARKQAAEKHKARVGQLREQELQIAEDEKSLYQLTQSWLKENSTLSFAELRIRLDRLDHDTEAYKESAEEFAREIAEYMTSEHENRSLQLLEELRGMLRDVDEAVLRKQTSLRSRLTMPANAAITYLALAIAYIAVGVSSGVIGVVIEDAGKKGGS